MGCNCAGSTPRNQSGSGARATPAPATTKRVDGGPGQAGYAWNGPPRPPKNP